MCKHRSLSTPTLLGACAVLHCQGPVIQGQYPWENTWHTSGCCSVLPASATAGSHCIVYPSLPLAWVSQSPLISCHFNPTLSGQGTDALRRPTCRGGAKSKAESVDRSSRQKINKATVVLNDTIDQVDLIDSYRTLHPKQQNTHSFQVHVEHIPGYHMLGHKTNLNTFKRIEIIIKDFLQPQPYETRNLL